MPPTQPDTPRMHPRFLALILLLLVLSIWLCSPALAMAHKVTVFAWVEGDSIHTQSKFSGGKFVNGGRIEVQDSQGNILQQGSTDAQGLYSFPAPREKQDVKIIVIAGSGHTNHWSVRAEELGAAPSRGEAAAESPSDPEPAAASPHPVRQTPAPCPDGEMDAEILERMIQLALEKNLAPIRAQLAENAWGLRDILSGIGYILGLMGLASYLHYRQAGRPPRHD